MDGPKHAYHSKERLYYNAAHSLGDRIRETFRQIPANRGGLHGYLTGIQVIITGIIKERIATNPLLKEDVWGLMGPTTVRGNSHVWLDNCPSEIIVAANLIDEIIQPDNHDGFVDADFASSTDDQNLRMEWMIPICPKMFRSAGTKGNKDGIWPLAAMLDQGVIDFTLLASLGGAWQVKPDTNLTVKIVLHTYYTEDAIFSNPWRIQTSTTSDSRYTFPAFEGKCDMLFISDDNHDVYTLPTGNPRLTVDGLVIQDTLTGFEIHAAHDVGRDRGLNDEWDNVLLPLVCSTSQKGFMDCLYGSKYIVDDCNDTNSASRYTIRRSMDLGVEGSAVMAELLQVRINPAAEQNRLELAGSRTRAGELKIPRARVMGANTRVKE